MNIRMRFYTLDFLSTATATRATAALAPICGYQLWHTVGMALSR